MKNLNALRWLLGAAVALLVALSAAPAIKASSTGTATITVYARGAAMGQPVEVQWGDGVGGWHRVDGWTGTLDNINPQGVPFKRWTIFSSVYGQKPFRWVIYNPDGQTIWVTGPPFTLPTVDGTDYAQALDHQITPVPVAATPVPVSNGPVAPAPGLPLLRAHTFTFGQPCFSGDCSHSEITALIGGLPSYTWITVQWQDGLGQWHPVDGWQGMASSVDANGGLFQQWDIGPELFGRGPFRWVLYDSQGGSIVGVSSEFNMPLSARLNLFMSMAPFDQP